MSKAAIAELAGLDQWVIYNSASDKAPRRLNAAGNKLIGASHSDPAHWSSYDDAIRTAATMAAAGVGFVFHESDPYSGIDLDGCRDKKTGEIEGWARRIIDQAHSYTEVSPSGTGVKIFVRGILADTVIHKLGEHKGIEIYSKQRYFTVTGQHLAGTPEQINDAQNLLEQLSKEYAPAPVERPAAAALDLSSRTRPRAGQVNYKDTIARIKKDICLLAEMERRGCTIVGRRGNMLDLSAMAGDSHTHKITYTLTPSTSGPGYIAKSKSPSGKMNSVDYPRGFDVVTLLKDLDHGGSTVELMKAFNPIEPRRRCQDPPMAEPERRVQTPEQAADAARKRAARRAAAAATLDQIQARAHADQEMSDRATLVLLALMDCAGDRDWCRPSVARLADMLQICERYVHDALRELESRRYIRSSHRTGGTSYRTFLRLQDTAPEVTETKVNADEYILELESSIAIGACERAPAEQPPAISGIAETEPDTGGASYVPPAVEPSGAYTGRPKHFMNASARWALSSEAIQIRADADDQAEQQPAQRRPGGRRAEISAFDRYLLDLARMNDSELAGEVKKHQATLRKHAGAAWLKDVRAKLRAVQEAIDRYDGPPAGSGEQRRSSGQGAARAQPHKLLALDQQATFI